jgi:hypothetical protein
MKGAVDALVKEWIYGSLPSMVFLLNQKNQLIDRMQLNQNFQFSIFNF